MRQTLHRVPVLEGLILLLSRIEYISAAVIHMKQIETMRV